jgi:hypothetical protein
LDIEDGIRRISLHEDCLVFGESQIPSAVADGGKEGHGVKIAISGLGACQGAHRANFSPIAHISALNLYGGAAESLSFDFGASFSAQYLDHASMYLGGLEKMDCRSPWIQIARDHESILICKKNFAS